MRKWQSAAFAGTAAAVLLTAACGTEAAQQDQDTVQPAAGAQAATGGYGPDGGYVSDDYGSDGAAPRGGAERREPARKLGVTEDAGLGQVVTDSKGFTLYRFDKDTARPPKSNCNGGCEKAWPPVPANDASASDGLDADLLSEVVRADGTRQLTLAGWPVYRFAKDTAAGQSNGHGVGGTWNALAPDGRKAGSATVSSPPLSVAESGLGKIIVDGRGRTLYRFTKDSAWPMKSDCVGTCLKTWKPARPVDASRIEGINPELLSTLKRPDGEKQLSIDCWPLYWFTGDLKPGDVNGQGVNGTWFAVSKDGKLVKGASRG